MASSEDPRVSARGSSLFWAKGMAGRHHASPVRRPGLRRFATVRGSTPRVWLSPYARADIRELWNPYGLCPGWSL